MRTAYGAQLDELTEYLCSLAREAGDAIAGASEGLLGPILHRAEAVISRADHIEALGARAEDHAVTLLALQSPVAVDLRRVFSAVRMSGDLARMGGLAVHIAESVRRRHPESILPDGLIESFTELADLTHTVAVKLLHALESTDPGPIRDLDQLVEQVDRLHDNAIAYVSVDGRVPDVTSAVDVALLCRFYQRYVYQGMDVANRVVFLVEGSMPPVVP